MLLLLLFMGCELDIDDLSDPPEPSFLEVTVACAEGTLSVEALIESEYDVANVVIERIDQDEAELDPLFPTLDVSAIGGQLTRWELETTHDCDEPMLTTWTAYTVLESQASVEVAWPDVDLSEGAIDPPYGSDAGGSTVAIGGSAMDEVTAVWFADAQGELLDASDEVLYVLTPAGSAGAVDVTLEAPFTEVLLDDAFTYYPDATGTITGLSQMHLHVYSTTWFTIGSAYTTLDPYGPFVQLEVILQEPLLPEESYPMVYGEAGECSGGSYEWAALDVGAYINFASDDLGSLAMLSNGDGQPVYYYVESDVDPELWSGQLFSLGLPEAAEQFPAITVEDALLIPTMPTDPSFDWTIANQFTWGEDLVFTWADSSAQRVSWTLYPAQGSTVLGSVSCMADATTGELSVPWETLTADVDENQVTALYAVLSFIEDEYVQLPHDNSEFWSMGLLDHWLYATVDQP